MPCPLEKFVARSPAMLMPAVTAAAACSPSGSKNRSRRPNALGWPAATACAHPSPICVDGVIGYAPAPSLAAVSISTTALLPSRATSSPGNAGALGASDFLRMNMLDSCRWGPGLELGAVQPDDRAGRAALRCSDTGVRQVLGVHDREAALDGHDRRRILCAAAAGVTRDRAHARRDVAAQEVPTLDEQLLLERLEGEEP